MRDTRVSMRPSRRNIAAAISTGLLMIVFVQTSLSAERPPAIPLPADGNPRTVYLSTGDNQDVLAFAPLDSPQTVHAMFDALKRYRVNRIWWRGGQDEVRGRTLRDSRTESDVLADLGMVEGQPVS